MTCAVVLALSAWANDLIVSVKSERIDAIIQEVSDTEVRYKKASNPNGPTFVMKTSDVATIIYANGDVQAFEHSEQPQPQSLVVVPEKKPQANKGRFGEITKDDDTYYYNGEAMDLDTYLQFVKVNCPAAYNSYTSGKKLRKAGGALMGVGIPVLCGGIVMYTLGFPGILDNYGIEGLYIPGALCMGLGSGMFTASIPLMAVGNHRKRNSHLVFNEKCAAPQASAQRLYLDFNAGPASAGIALRF